MSSIGTIIHLTREDLIDRLNSLKINEIKLEHFKRYETHKFSVDSECGSLSGEMTYGVDFDEVRKAHTIIFIEDGGKEFKILKDRYITKY